VVNKNTNSFISYFIPTNAAQVAKPKSIEVNIIKKIELKIYPHLLNETTMQIK
jgi:hypothetical protein